MFARGVLSLHTAPLSVPKTLATNSRISITSKLIQTKALQVLYSGHLRKTGGRRSYRLVHAAHLGIERGLGAKSCYFRTYVTHRGGGVPVSWSDRSRNSFVSPTYAKMGGYTPCKNVGAPTFALSLLPIPTPVVPMLPPIPVFR